MSKSLKIFLVRAIYLGGLLIISLLSLSSCEKVFEYSPYQAELKDEYKGVHAKNLAAIDKIVIDNQTVKFAVVADNHYHYDNLRTVLDDINQKNDVLFVIFAGDIADQALLKEYEIFYNVMKHLDKPYLTVIGNHDYNSNGEAVYKDMFGEYNYSFVFNQYKFVFFDDVVWESNQKPKFNWLEKEIANTEDYKQTVVISHLPPFSDQLKGGPLETEFATLLRDNGIGLSLHGHTHGYYYKEQYNDGVKYMVTPWLKQPSYTIVTLDGPEHHIELVNL